MRYTLGPEVATNIVVVPAHVSPSTETHVGSGAYVAAPGIVRSCSENVVRTLVDTKVAYCVAVGEGSHI